MSSRGLILAEQAARKSLEASGVGASELGAIIVGTGTPQRVFPGVSASLQQRLGNTRAFAFDIHLSSIGGLAALGVGCDLCPRLGPILVVGAEKMSLCVGDHPCKETTILFGDGAGACLLAPGSGPYRVLDWCLGGDGSHADDLCLDWGGQLVMHGRTVSLHAIHKLQATVRDLCARTGQDLGEVDLFLFHQANLKLLRLALKRHSVPATSPVSSPMGLSPRFRGWS